MIKVTAVQPLEDLHIRVRFSDGSTSDIDIKPFIRGGISDALLDEDFFKQVTLDELSGIAWPNGFDFCPNTLWELAQGNYKEVA